MKKLNILIIISILIIAGCTLKKRNEAMSNNPIEIVFSQMAEKFPEITKSPNDFRLQILFTQVDRNENNQPILKSHSFNVQTEKYFYPASTVKFPAAVVALEKLNNLNISGLNKFTSLKIDSAFTGQTSVLQDLSAPDNLPTIAHYIKKILIVSDNDAYNRIYEFVGQACLNKTLKTKGFENTHLIRRLSVAGSPEQNRTTNPFTFYNGNTTIYEQPLEVNPNVMTIKMAEVKQGKGYMSAGKLIEEPIDFTYSNYISISDLQRTMQMIIFPELFPKEQQFNLTKDDYDFLRKYLSIAPRNSDVPIYQNEEEYNDGYAKFFIVGDTKNRTPDGLKIYSKSGLAYGYVLDNAYIQDEKSGVEFFLTAVIQVNKNQIYNDDTYEYDELGFPFMAELGRQFLKLEKLRKRE